MRRIQPTHLRICNRFAIFGIISSFILFFASFLINGSSIHAFILFLGIYLLAASMFLFGFGLFLTMLEELTSKHRKQL